MEIEKVGAMELEEQIDPRSNSRILRWFRLLAVAFGATVSTLVLTFILIWMLVPRYSAPSPTSNLCQSESCIRANAMLLRNVDLSVDPCNDFYNFACGGVSKIPYSAETIDTGVDTYQEEAIKLTAKLFELFYNADLVRSDDHDMNFMYQAVRQIFHSCIGWHSSEIWWLPEKLKWMWKKESGKGDYNVKMLIDAVMKPIHNASSFEEFMSALVRTESSGLIKLKNLDDFELEMDAFNLIKAAMENKKLLLFSTLRFNFAATWSAEVFTEIKQLFNKFNLKPVGTYFSDIISHQLALSTIYSRDYFIGNMSELQSRTNKYFGSAGGTFSWVKFITYLQGYQIEESTLVYIENIDGFMKYLLILASEFRVEQQGALYDLIRVDAAMILKNFLSSDEYPLLKRSYSEGKFLFDRDDKRGSYKEFSTFCLAFAKNSLRPVVHEMFREAFINDNFTLVHSVINQIQLAMKSNIDDEAWIKSKQSIKQWIDRIKQIVSYVKIPISDIKSMFKPTMQLLNSAKHFGDIVSVHQDAQLRQKVWMFTPGTPVNERIDGLISQLEYNAQYTPFTHTLLIFTGILSTYIYDKNYPNFLLYGGVGHVIGHEIAHSLDPKSFSNVLTDNGTLTVYRNKTQRLINSYNQIALIPNSTMINGAKTVVDNFADIVGINAAFRAYKAVVARSGMSEQKLPGVLGSRLSPEQLFFVQAAQFNCGRYEPKKLKEFFEKGAHASPRARVVGTMQNSNEFARVFQCKPGDRMYLTDAEKCHFW